MSVQQQVMQSMREMQEQFQKAGISLTMPPPSNATLRTEYVAIEIDTSLSAKIPFQQTFTNPLHMYQGGFLCAAFDEVFGPLTYMIAKQPVVTLEMSTTFIRPFTAKDEYIVVKADLVAKTKSILILKAEARTKEGKLIATSSNHSMLLSTENLKQKNGQ